MPWTNFPFGISLTTATGTVSGQLNATSITLTTSTNAAAGVFTFGTASGGTGIFSGTVTAGTFSGTGDVITATNVSAAGQLISASSAGIIGGKAALIFSFSTVSALQVASIPVPFAGSLDNVYVTTGSVSAVVASYTVRIGSAGSVAVATVSNTTASQGVQEALTTTQTTFALTNSLVATRSAQGTAGDTALCLVVRQTA